MLRCNAPVPAAQARNISTAAGGDQSGRSGKVNRGRLRLFSNSLKNPSSEGETDRLKATILKQKVRRFNYGQGKM